MAEDPTDHELLQRTAWVPDDIKKAPIKSAQSSKTSSFIEACQLVASAFEDYGDLGGDIGEEISALRHDITMLISVNKAIQKIQDEVKISPSGDPPWKFKKVVQALWDELYRNTEGCKITILDLEKLKHELGRENRKSQDYTKKAEDLSPHKDQLSLIHHRLSEHHANLHTLMVAVNVLSAPSSHYQLIDLANLSEEDKVRQKNTLQAWFDRLPSKAMPIDDDLRSLMSSTTVVESSEAQLMPDLVALCVRVLSHLNQSKNSTADFNEEIQILQNEINAIISVLNALSKLKTSASGDTSASLLENRPLTKKLWTEVELNMKGCKATIQTIENQSWDILGKSNFDKNETSQSQEERESFIKATGFQMNFRDIKKVSHRLSMYQTTLQILLASLNVIYIRSSHTSADINAGNLSAQLQAQGFVLRYRLDSLVSSIVKINSADRDSGSSNFSSAAEAALSVASSLHLNKYFSIPVHVSTFFTGREKEFEILKTGLNVTSLDKLHPQKRFVVYGCGGSGKTQFCCKFAQDNREKFWGVFYLDASSKAGSDTSFQEIANVGGVDPDEHSVKIWLSNLEQPWLLMIDGADDPDISMEDYFPKGDRGLIMITTRNPRNKTFGNIGPGSFDFNYLESSAAVTLLLRCANEPEPWGEATKQSAALIASTLGDNPLALSQAGKAIFEGLCDLKHYLQFYEMSLTRIRLNSDTHPSRNIYSAYESIIWKLEGGMGEQYQDAIELLNVFAYFDYNHITVEILVAAAKTPLMEHEALKNIEEKPVKIKPAPNPLMSILRIWILKIAEMALRDRSPVVLPSMFHSVSSLDSIQDFENRVRAALNILTQYSLITFNDSTNSYSMHPLVHTWVRERPSTSTGQQAVWCEAAATIIARAISPQNGLVPLEVATFHRGLLPHILNVRRIQNTIHQGFSDNQRARRISWTPVWKPIFGDRKAIQMTRFAWVYFLCGYWNEAEELQFVVKSFVCSRFRREDPRSISIARYLTDTWRSQGRINKAVELLSWSLQGSYISFGSEHPTTIQLLDQVAMLYCEQGRHLDAELLHQTAAQKMDAVQGPNHEDTLIALDHLGCVLQRLFRFEDAMKLHSKAFHGLEVNMGATYEATLSAKENLALAYCEIGGITLANVYMEDVFQQRETELGKEHPYTLFSISNLAWIKNKLGLWEEAEIMLRQVLPIIERNLGRDHTAARTCSLRLAHTLVSQEQYIEAGEIYRGLSEPGRYESLNTNDFDGEHPDRIHALVGLIELFRETGETREALETCEELELILRTSVHPLAVKVKKLRKELGTLHPGYLVPSAQNQRKQASVLGEPPKSSIGNRRLEWTCECGDKLNADFENTDSLALDELENALQTTNDIAMAIVSNINTHSQPEAENPVQSLPQMMATENPRTAITASMQELPELNDSSVTLRAINPSQQQNTDDTPHYLALCVNKGGIYKILEEIHVPQNISDVELFKRVRVAYRKIRGGRGIYSILMAPIDIHFVLFRLWHLREGYISIHDKPACMPSSNSSEYHYIPRPLSPLPPIPPETLIHYLEHHDDDCLGSRTVWAPRLPKRKADKLIQCPVGTEGWGIHVVEGPRRIVVSWVVVATVIGSILASFLWSWLRKDIQGGTGLGSFIIALPPVLMMGFLFRINGI